jgi:ATP-dependent Clp protease ATP-binding subunit ClpC
LMQGVWSPPARAILDRATVLAGARRGRVVTLDLLAAVLESPSELTRRLRSRGLRGQDLRAATRLHEEPTGLVERIHARGRALAEVTAATDFLATHLIAAALAEPQSSLAVWSTTLGVDPVALAEEIVRDSAAAPVVRALPAAAPVARAAGGGRPSSAVRPSPASAASPLAVPSVASRVKLSPLDARRVAPARALAAVANATPPSVSTPAPMIPATAAPANVHAAPPVRSASSGRGRATRSAPPEGSVDARSFPTLAALALPRVLEVEVVGRDGELDRLRDALGRREGRGALVVGSPGVGRTTFIRAFAAQSAAPVVMLRHVELAARLRGGDADAIRGICAEVRKSGAVVALDPLAPWLGGRDVPDVVQVELRALLASGEVSWIGVATPEESRRITDTDAWVERAAVRLELDELNPALVRGVVRAQARRLGGHHHVAVTDAVADRAVELADRYLGGRAQPDRSLAALDLAFTRARRRGDAALAAETVAQVVAELAGMPPDRLAATDHERLLALETSLASRVVGHAGALARVAHVLRRNAVGFRGQRPVGTFLLLGPTGVGKTETAKAVAEALFPGVGAMTRFDMAEYAEPHAVARLVGAPPGYVGYGDGGQLTEAVRRRPYQLILLDEVEKAHRDVLEALLGLLDEARLTDGRGRTVDFRHTVVVMTSNLGAELYQSRASSRAIGFGSARAAVTGDELAPAVLAAARSALPPELWNRIDEPLVFGPLDRDEVAEVARRMLAQSLSLLADEQGVTVTFAPSVVELLLERGGYDAALGARPMRRAVSRLVEAPLAEAVLRGVLRRGDHAALVARDGGVHVEPAARAAPTT